MIKVIKTASTKSGRNTLHIRFAQTFTTSVVKCRELPISKTPFYPQQSTLPLHISPKPDENIV
jgi:hypothetical protein